MEPNSASRPSSFELRISDLFRIRPSGFGFLLLVRLRHRADARVNDRVGWRALFDIQEDSLGLDWIRAGDLHRVLQFNPRLARIIELGRLAVGIQELLQAGGAILLGL